jgi:hypothetical protein
MRIARFLGASSLIGECNVVMRDGCLTILLSSRYGWVQVTASASIGLWGEHAGRGFAQGAGW